MSNKLHSFEAVRAEVFVDIEKRLADFFDAEERRIERMSLRSLDQKEAAEARRVAKDVLFDIRLKALLRISREITDAQETQSPKSQRIEPFLESPRPVGKRLILQVLAMSDDAIAN